MSREYEVVCIGGGLAGATLALKMAEAGARVLVLERSDRFSDRVRGEWLAPWGVHEATRLGLRDAFAEAGAHELPALAGRSLKPRLVSNTRGDAPLTFFHPTLQSVLLERAERSGASVIRGARATSVTTRAGVTVQYAGRDGIDRVRARVAVGADGRSSVTRAALQRERHAHVSNRVLAGVRLADVRCDPSFGYFIIDEDGGGVASLFPQGNGYARAYLFEPGASPSRFLGKDGFARFMEALVRAGVPPAALTTARAAGPLAAFAADDSWIRHPASNCIALVGDAAGISDPTWGMGTSLILRDARVLSELLTSRTDWRAALHSYASQRDRYYQSVITAERWQSEIQLTPGPAATKRRVFILELWRREPDRAIDLPGRGPDTDVSERGRVRVFGEDVSGQRPLETVCGSLAAMSA
jgi:2-polyprenyl-6-methoxyphenol hydroxylase-like FAD-dependent oxidoreductase